MSGSFQSDKDAINYFKSLINGNMQVRPEDVVEKLEALMNEKTLAHFSSHQTLLAKILWHYIKLLSAPAPDFDEALKQTIRNSLPAIFWNKILEKEMRAELLERVGAHWLSEKEKLMQSRGGWFSFLVVFHALVPLEAPLFQEHVRPILEEPEAFGHFIPALLNFSQPKTDSWDYGCRLLYALFDDPKYTSEKLRLLVGYFHRHFSEWFPPEIMHARVAQLPQPHGRLQDLADRLRLIANPLAAGQQAENVAEDDAANDPLAGLKHEEVSRDGHCFFHAIVRCLTEEELNQFEVNDYRTLRQKIGEWIEADLENFRPFVEGETDEAVRAYIADIQEGNKWGGQPEIMALQRQLNRPVIVIQKNNPIVMHGDLSGYLREPIFLFLHHGHYSILRAREGMPGRDTLALIQSHLERGLPVNYNSASQRAPGTAQAAIAAALFWAIDGQSYDEQTKGVCIRLVHDLFTFKQGERIRPFSLDTLLAMTYPLIEPILSEPPSTARARLGFDEDQKERLPIHKNTFQNYCLGQLAYYKGQRTTTRRLVELFLDTQFVQTFPGQDAVAHINQSLLQGWVATLIGRDPHSDLASTLDDFLREWIQQWRERADEDLDLTALEQVVFCMLRGLLSSKKTIQAYTLPFEALMDLYFEKVVDADADANEASLERLNDVVSLSVQEDSYPSEVYAIFARRFFYRQKQPNQFAHAHLTPLAWHCLHVIVRGALNGSASINEKMYRDLRNFFLLSVQAVETRIFPQQKSDVQRLCARLALACFLETKHIDLRHDAPLFHQAFVYWDRLFNNSELPDPECGVNGILPFFKDRSQREVLRQPMLVMVVYRYYLTCAQLGTWDSEQARLFPPSAIDNPAGHQEFRFVRRLMAGIVARCFPGASWVEYGESQRFFSEAHLFSGSEDALVIQQLVQDDQEERQEEHKEAPWEDLEAAHRRQHVLSSAEPLAAFAENDRSLTGLVTTTPAPSPPHPHFSQEAALKALFFGASLASWGWGAVQFSLLAEYPWFPNEDMPKPVVVLSILLLSVQHWAYEYEELKAALHRRQNAKSPTAPVIGHRSHINVFGRSLVLLFCCAEGFMRAMGIKSVLEKFLGGTSGLQWMFFSHIFAASFRQFRLGEGYAFRTVFEEGLFAQDKSFARGGGLSRKGVVALVAAGALLLSLGGFSLVFVESYEFFEHQLLSDWNETDKINWSYFLSGLLGATASVFVACKMGADFKRACYQGLPSVYPDVQKMGKKLGFFLVACALGASTVYGLVLYQVMRDGVEIVFPKPGLSRWQGVLVGLSALSAVQYLVVRAIPSMVGLAAHFRHAHEDPRPPLSHSGYPYTMRLMMSDFVQLAAVGLPMLIPGSWRHDSWRAYSLPSTIMAGILVGRMAYHRSHYRQQSLPYTAVPYTAERQRAPIPLSQSILITILGILGVYGGAFALEGPWRSAFKKTGHDEASILWRAQLNSVLTAAFVVLAGARGFLCWKNRHPMPPAEPLRVPLKRAVIARSANISGGSQARLGSNYRRQASLFVSRLRGEPESARLMDGRGASSDEFKLDSAIEPRG